MAKSGSAPEKWEPFAWVTGFLRVPLCPRLWDWGSRLHFMVPSRNEIKVFPSSGRPEQLWGAAAASQIRMLGVEGSVAT